MSRLESEDAGRKAG